MVFVQQPRFAHRQSDIETVEVRIRGRMTRPISNTLYIQLCVYRHGTNKLFKFEYVVTVTRERPTDDAKTSKGDAR